MWFAPVACRRTKLEASELFDKKLRVSIPSKRGPAALRADLLRVLVQAILISDLILILILVFQLIAVLIPVLELIRILVQPVLVLESVSILVSEDIRYIRPRFA
jgi:hypothetical protein